MTFEQKVKVKVNYLSASLINEIAKWIRVNSKEEFFNKTSFTQDDLNKMIDLKYQFDMVDIAELSACFKRELLILIGHEEKSNKDE